MTLKAVSTAVECQLDRQRQQDLPRHLEDEVALGKIPNDVLARIAQLLKLSGAR